MTPAELITRKLMAHIETAGASVPILSLLIEALEGTKKETPSSGIALNVHIASQPNEAVPIYSFSATAILTVAIDDDKGGTLFAENYDALWRTFDALARQDACTALGDENDELPDGTPHVFAVDGFQLEEGDAPDYQEDDNGGAWTVSFRATISGRAT